MFKFKLETFQNRQKWYGGWRIAAFPQNMALNHLTVSYKPRFTDDYGLHPRPDVICSSADSETELKVGGWGVGTN